MSALGDCCSCRPGTAPGSSGPPALPSTACPVCADLEGTALQSRGTGAPATADLLCIPGYEVLEELGRGSMGVVYQALHLRLNRRVALKTVRDRAHATPEDLVRFLGEAELVARLQHPHIVQVYEVGHHEARPYFTMELIDGGSLAHRLGGHPQPARRAAALVETLARAMHYAHLQGIVHRDLKPANVLLTADGQPKITDFGLAKRLEGAAELTDPGEMLGTPRYMAPEQAAGAPQDVGPLTDVHALGVILYELLTGRPPYLAKSVLETVRQVVHEEPEPPARRGRGVPRDVDTICLKCLQKEPAKRYASALDLADDLRHFLAGEPVRARPARPWERALRWGQRHTGALALWAAGGVATLAAAGLLWGAARVLLGAGVLAAVAAANLVQCRRAVQAITRERDEAVRARIQAEGQRDAARRPDPGGGVRPPLRGRSPGRAPE